MRTVSIFLLLFFSASMMAQSFYYTGTKTESFSSAQAAWSFVQNNLDSRQQAHVTVIPVRIIDGPLSSNPPDVMTWIVLWQPSSNNSTDGMVDAAISGQPAQSWFNGTCGGSVSGSYTAINFSSSSSALSAFGSFMSDAHQAPFASLLTQPDLGDNKYVVLFPSNTSGFCR